VKVLGRSRSSLNAREPMAVGVYVCVVGWKGFWMSRSVVGTRNWVSMRRWCSGGVAGHVHFDIS